MCAWSGPPAGKVKGKKRAGRRSGLNALQTILERYLPIFEFDLSR